MLAAITTTAESAKPPRPKRWIPLSLRLFVALMSLLFVGSVLWVGVRGYRQRTAILAIKERGGRVSLRSVGPRWIRRLIGEDWNNLFGKPVEVVIMEGSAADDSLLADVADLADLDRVIILGPAPMTDAGLAKLVGMTELDALFIPDTDVTDVGLSHISRLSNLTVLDLTGAKITGAGLKCVGALHKLEILHLCRALISDADIADLQTASPNLVIVADGNSIRPLHRRNAPQP